MDQVLVQVELMLEVVAEVLQDLVLMHLELTVHQQVMEEQEQQVVLQQVQSQELVVEVDQVEQVQDHHQEELEELEEVVTEKEILVLQDQQVQLILVEEVVELNF